MPVESAAMGSKHFPASGGGKIADRRTQLKRLSRQSPRDQETERAFIEAGHATIRAELSSDPITSSDCAYGIVRLIGGGLPDHFHHRLKETQRRLLLT